MYIHTHVHMFYTCTFRERDKFLSMLGVASTGASELIYVAVESSHFCSCVVGCIVYMCNISAKCVNMFLCLYVVSRQKSTPWTFIEEDLEEV